MPNTTEHPEEITTGMLKSVGIDGESIYKVFKQFMRFRTVCADE